MKLRNAQIMNGIKMPQNSNPATLGKCTQNLFGLFAMLNGMYVPGYMLKNRSCKTSTLCVFSLSATCNELKIGSQLLKWQAAN